MAPSTNKKTLIQRFDRENLVGYLNPGSYLQPRGVELLNLSGVLLQVPYDEIKSVSFVREFEAPDPQERRTFSTRPKSPGLWVRMRFKDNDQMEGLLANNLLLLEAFGFSFTPPDASSNIQRVFVPKQAVAEFEVLAVVGSPYRKEQKAKEKQAAKEQLDLFQQS